MHNSYKKWLEDGKPKVYCQCQYHEEISVKSHHSWCGIPKYIHGHNKRIHLLPKSYKQWLDDDCPKVYCQCGCNGEITIKDYYKYNDIPKYIFGHQNFGENNPMYDIHKFGEENHNWKGGIISLNKNIRHLDKYIEWRLQIFGRDNFTCQSCGVRGVYLEVHHIKPFNEIIKEYNIKKSEDALNCEVLWDLNNGITYCLNCHNKLKKKGGILEILI